MLQWILGSGEGILKAKDNQFSAIDIVAAASHELKTPLTVISGLADMMLKGQCGTLANQQRQYLERIETSSDRMLALLNSLLSVGKLHRGALAIEPEPVLLKAVVYQVAKELSPLIKQRRVKLDVRSGRPALPVLVDKEFAYQIVFNLLDNAIKYSYPKTVVTIKFKGRGDKQALLISDQGIGIRPGEFKHLFTRFGTTAQPVNAHSGSSGLGLFIVKNLVEQIGGQVYARALPRGSCFVVELPLAKQLTLFSGV